MLTREEIGRIKAACDELPIERVSVLSLAAAHRVLPVYQVYSEVQAALGGYELVHDGLVGTWRVLRARPGASAAKLTPRLEVVIVQAEADLQLINDAETFDLPEALVAEAISAAVLALRAYLESARDIAFNAMMSALEVDNIWGEDEADRSGSDGAVSWDGVMTHYQRQVTDIGALSSDYNGDDKVLFRDLARRSEQEGMTFLARMRELISTDAPQLEI